MAKTSGQWRGVIGHYQESEFYNPNDLGYLAAPNELATWGNLEYGIYKPFGSFNRMWWTLNSEVGHLYAPRAYSNWTWNAEWAAVTRTCWFNKLTIDGQPIEGQDWFASRIPELPFNLPSSFGADFVTSTDYRRVVAVDGFIRRTWRREVNDWQEFFLRLAPQVRFSDRLSANYVWSLQARHNERGFADLVDAEESNEVSLFGRRENTSHTHVLNANYMFTPRSSLSARVRHYWSVVDYHEFFELQTDGQLVSTPWASAFMDDNGETSRYDTNYNAWSVDLVYRWIFSPGSELTVVWKNTLNESGSLLPDSYAQNWERMLTQGFTNSLSIRALYYLDYSLITNRRQS